MTRIGSVIITATTPDDVRVLLSDRGTDKRASVWLGALAIYGTESGATDDQLRQIVAFGQTITAQANAHLADAPVPLFPARVAIHVPVDHLDDGELEGWADGLDASASGCPVTVTCDGDSFEEWGAICVPGEPLHVVATCNADYTEVARVAAWIGEVAGLDGDPIVTDAGDWSKHLGPKAVA